MILDVSNHTVFVIAGGKSSRMGADKALLEFGGMTLLDRMVEIARCITSNVQAVGNPDKYSSIVPTVSDTYPERGPLGGIHAALRSTQSDLNLMLAVDMPFTEAEFLRYLFEVAGSSTTLVTVPHALGRFQPLCAVYRREFADLAEEALASGNNKVDRLFRPDVTRVVTQDEIERLAFPVSMFDNLNTPEDLDRARAKSTE